jgi:hypothetical protein
MPRAKMGRSQRERGTRLDDRRFDQLSRRLAGMALPSLPRRALVTALGATALTGVLADFDAAAKKKGQGQGNDKDRDKDKDKNDGNGANRAAAANGTQDEVQQVFVDDEADASVNADSRQSRGAGSEAKDKKCKKEGKKCDKKKCKDKDKKCCCSGLKCKNDRCEGKGGKCPLELSNALDWGDSGTGNGDFDSPFGITTDPDGIVYVTDTGNFRVQTFNANGVFDDEWGSEGLDNDEFQLPLGISFGEDSGGAARVYVTDPDQTSEGRRFRKFRINGVHEGNLGTGLTEPVGVAVDADQNVWIVDTTGEIFLYDEDGDPITSWDPDGDGNLFVPEGIGVFEDDDNRTFVFVADTGNDRIVKFEYIDNSADGLEFLNDAGSTGSGSTQFREPVGIAVDACGNLWVADRNNDRIQQLDKNLNFESRVTNNYIEPTGVALSPNGKALYVVDSGNDRVRKYNLS